MNVIQKALILVVTFLLIFSCKKPPEEPQPDKLIGDKAILVGTWNWTHTHHRFNWCDGPELNETIEPEEDNYSFIMKEEGKVEFYKNGIKESEHLTFFNQAYEYNDEYIFNIYLDNIENENLGLVLYSEDSLFSSTYPYSTINEGCELYKSYFSKE